MQQSSLIPSQEPEASKKKNPFWHDDWEIVETLILAVILYFAIDAVFARVRVENISMENTLMPGDFSQLTAYPKNSLTSPNPISLARR